MSPPAVEPICPAAPDLCVVCQINGRFATLSRCKRCLQAHVAQDLAARRERASENDKALALEFE